MSAISQLIRLLWRIITFPIWFPWLVITKFGRQLWRLAQALWTAGVWIVKTLWRLNLWFFTTFYWKPFKFVFMTVPPWIYRTFIAPIGRLIGQLNTLVAHGIYHVLSRWTADQQTTDEGGEDITPPAPQLEAQIYNHCSMCDQDTPHTSERISEATMDTLDTCTRCGSRKAGSWHSDTPLLEVTA